MRAGRRLPGRWWLAAALGILAVAVIAWWSTGQFGGDPLASARAAYDREDWDACAAAARTRLRAAPGDLNALRLLARSSSRLGRDESALSLFDRIGPDALGVEDLCVLGQTLSRLGKRKAALDAWERARSIDPAHGETLFELTRAYLSADRLEDAARAGHELSQRPGWESRAEALLGSLALERNDPAAAADDWIRALARPRPVTRAGGVPDPIVPRAELAEALLRAGRPAEARAQLERMPAEPRDARVEWLLSRADLQQRDWGAFRLHFARGAPYREERPMMTEPSPYVGTSACAECHPAEFRVQQASRHARTFSRPAQLAGLAVPSSAVPDTAVPRVLHAMRRQGGSELVQSARVGDRVLEAVVQYAFGSGDRGMTFVGRDAAGKSFELRLSTYSSSDAGGAASQPGSRWDVTAGHPRTPEHDEEYLGQPLTEDLVRRCLLCHVTDPRSIVANTGPCAADRAIGCERCHGPGGHHLLAVEGKTIEADMAIARPTLASGARVVQLCAGCHSPRGQQVRRDDPVAVRFQGTTLTWSRCYTESQDRMDCLTCHDPHRNASTTAADYEARCLDCHAEPGRHAATRPADSGAAGARRRDRRARTRLLEEDRTHTTCPVNPSTGCIACHMPAVEGIVPHSTFTDHDIRVHRD